MPASVIEKFADDEEGEDDFGDGEEGIVLFA